MQIGDDPSVKLWLSSLSSQRDRLSFLSRFLNEVLSKDTRFRGLTPSQLLEFQENAMGRARYILGDLARNFINSLPMTRSSKVTRLSHINSFFNHGHAPLPSDPAFRFNNCTPSVDGDLQVEDLVTVIQNSNLKYATIFLMLAQAILDEKRFCYLNTHHAELVVEAVTKKQGVFRIPLPQRKQSPEPFFTMLDGSRSDFAVSFRRYMKTTTHDLSKCLFLNDFGNPITEHNISAYFHRRAVEKGLIHQVTPPCDKCGNRTVRRVYNRKEYGTPKVGYECSRGHIQLAENLDEDFKHRLKSHRSGKHPHEIRDLMRSRWGDSGANPVVAEFIMGHRIDKNGYNKMKYKTVVEVEYRRALPWLNILSCDPSKVDRASLELDLDGQKATIEQLQREVAVLRQRQRILDDPMLLRALKELAEKG